MRTEQLRHMIVGDASQTPTQFDYKLLRLLIGVIAFLIPLSAWLLAPSAPSISDSYHVDPPARNFFVGQLFVVASFLFAYNGRTNTQLVLSKVAAFLAVGVAVYPTDCPVTINLCTAAAAAAITPNTVHGTAAIGFFSILVIFCFIFGSTAAEKVTSDPVHRSRHALRAAFYRTIGALMAVDMVIGAYLKGTMSAAELERSQLILWVEWVALWLFAAAWIVAGREELEKLGRAAAQKINQFLGRDSRSA